MNNEIQIFNHEEFGEVRTIEIDGKIYFVGLDVAKALKYTRPGKAILDHVDEEDKKTIGDIATVLKWDGRKIRKDTSIINESGLYSLVLASKLEGAKKFKRWVTNEVLPSIRKTGTYSMNPPQIEEKSTVYYIENLNITNNYIEEKPTRKTSKKTYKKGDYMNDLNEIKELLIPYADYLGAKRDHKAGKDMYTCPLCHSGEHGTGSTGAFHIGYNKDGSLSYFCHSCGSNGNIISLHCTYYGISNTKENFPKIIQDIKSNLGIQTDDFKAFKESYKYHSPIEQSDLNPTNTLNLKDYTKFFNYTLSHQDKAIEYLKKRGVIHAESIAQHFQIGYSPNFAYQFEDNKPVATTSAVIIPFNANSYAWRSTTDNIKKKKGQVIPLNLGVLKDITKKWIFLVEGEFDLFSIIDISIDIPNCDFSCISVGSSVNLPKFIETYIKDNIQDNIGLIIALDGDMFTNSNVKQYVDKGLNSAMIHKIPCVIADVKELYLNQKDSNEALKFNREKFQKALIKEVEKAETLDITQYQKNCDKLIIHTVKKPNLYQFNYIGEINRCFNFAKDTIRYCNQSKTWYSWNGIRLEEDFKNQFRDILHIKIDEQCQQELKYYSSLTDEQLPNKEKFLKSAKKEHKTAISRNGLLNAIDGISVKEPIAINLSELDNPKYLNCNDFTLDLVNLTLKEHTITDLCTKLAPVDLNKPLNQRCIEDWNNFINDIMCHDNEMIEFIQRLFGYILELSNREECFIILYGNTTRNGKSTLLESISGTLGDYSKAVSSGTLSEKPTGKEANPEIIDLIGAKLITCGELNAETLLNDTLLKSISGNDTIPARLLFSNNVQNFQINGKLFANCNELPPMKNDDLLNSNRIIVVPFDRHFEEHEQNKDLKNIFSQSEYRAVILAWVIEGYKRYKQYGLKAHLPTKVVETTENYRSEANTINQFLNDDDVFEKIDIKDYTQAVKIADSSLYERYKEWCKDNGTFAHSKANFKKHLRKHNNYLKDGHYKGTKVKDILRGFKLKPTIIFTDEINSNNPNRLVAITQQELDYYKNK